MNSISRNFTSTIKIIDFEIFYSQISKNVIQLIQNALAKTYGDILDVIIGEELELPKEAYNSQRDQYKADSLLSYLQKTKKTYNALWIIQKDLYSRGMNFIFGYARYHSVAVLSIYRLFLLMNL